MQEGQKQFFNYIMECVQEGKEETAKSLLNDNFKRQSEGTFSKNDIESFHNEIVKILKPERKDEVIAIMNQFGNDHVSK